jgi:hypothetical protein
VNTSAAWTLAEAAAGGTPKARRTEDETIPYAIPSAPSTICARNPTIKNNRNISSISTFIYITTLSIEIKNFQVKPVQLEKNDKRSWVCREEEDSVLPDENCLERRRCSQPAKRNSLPWAGPAKPAQKAG